MNPGWGGGGAHGNDVPPGSPLVEHLLDRIERHPRPPAALDREGLEQRAQEQQCGEVQGLEAFGEPDGPVAQHVEGLGYLIVADEAQHAEGGERGYGAGQADGGDARADDRGRVPAELGRGARLWRQVERDHID